MDVEYVNVEYVNMDMDMEWSTWTWTCVDVNVDMEYADVGRDLLIYSRGASLCIALSLRSYYALG